MGQGWCWSLKVGVLFYPFVDVLVFLAVTFVERGNVSAFYAFKRVKRGDYLITYLVNYQCWGKVRGWGY